MTYKIPFTITPVIHSYTQDIAYVLGMLAHEKKSGAWDYLCEEAAFQVALDCLSLEKNKLDGHQKHHKAQEIKVVLSTCNPAYARDFLVLRHAFMKESDRTAPGIWRQKDMSLLDITKENTYQVPQPYLIPDLLQDFFVFLKQEESVSWLLKSPLCLYEIERIQPFKDSNSSMAMLWFQIALRHTAPALAGHAFTKVIAKNRTQYQNVLQECLCKQDATALIEYCLKNVLLTVKEIHDNVALKASDCTSRIESARSFLKDQWFSRNEYRKIHTDISTATASRDLMLALKENMVHKQGEKNKSRYQFKTI